MYYQAYRVRDAVGNREEFYFKFTQGKWFTGYYRLEVNTGTCAALFQLYGDNALGELGGIDRNIELGEDVGQGANVVFVTVGDDDTPYHVLSLKQIADVRDYQVNAKHFLFREHKPGINDDDIIFILHHHHVLADFTQPTEGDDF